MINLRIVPGRGTGKAVSEDSPKPKITIRGGRVEQVVLADSAPDEDVREQEAATSALEIFRYEEQEVRTVIRDGNPWFVAKDVCEILGLEQVTRAVSHLDSGGVTTSKVTDSLGRQQQTNIINESNLYKLIFQSRKPEAAQFTEWVTGTVLPSIRKYGVYAARVPQTYEDALEEIVKEIRQRKAIQVENERLALKAAEDASRLAIVEPKAESFDAFMSSKDGIGVREVAQMLDYQKMGQNNMFAFLRDIKLLLPNNSPYQQYIDAGYFRTIGQSYTRPDGEVMPTSKTLVLPRGVEYIRRRLDEAGYIRNNQQGGSK